MNSDHPLFQNITAVKSAADFIITIFENCNPEQIQILVPEFMNVIETLNKELLK